MEIAERDCKNWSVNRQAVASQAGSVHPGLIVQT